jgi:hypothetical protein
MTRYYLLEKPVLTKPFTIPSISSSFSASDLPRIRCVRKPVMPMKPLWIAAAKEPLVNQLWTAKKMKANTNTSQSTRPAITMVICPGETPAESTASSVGGGQRQG